MPLSFQAIYVNDYNGTDKAYFPHQDYNPSTRENDICLIKLEKEFDVSRWAKKRWGKGTYFDQSKFWIQNRNN